MPNEKMLTRKDSINAIKQFLTAATIIHEGYQFAFSFLPLPFLNPVLEKERHPDMFFRFRWQA